MEVSIVDQGFPITQAASKKPPRKPQPSKLAAKAAKKKKTAKPKTVKSKAKKPVKRKPAAKKSKVKKKVERAERLDFRLSKAEKARIVAKARKSRRTVTSILLEAVEKIK